MYVLTLKNRLNEFRAVQRLRELGLLDEGLLPLVEVVKKDVAFDKLVDPSTGEYVKVNHIKVESAKVSPVCAR